MNAIEAIDQGVHETMVDYYIRKLNEQTFDRLMREDWASDHLTVHTHKKLNSQLTNALRYRAQYAMARGTGRTPNMDGDIRRKLELIHTNIEQSSITHRIGES